MAMTIVRSVFIVVWSVLTMFGIQYAMAEDVRDLDAKIASVLPTPEEDRWLTIPWRTNLMEARLTAQQLRKPLFMWVMNGNPQGCT